jgi:hypothetical protein
MTIDCKSLLLEWPQAPHNSICIKRNPHCRIFSKEPSKLSRRYLQKVTHYLHIAMTQRKVIQCLRN